MNEQLNYPETLNDDDVCLFIQNRGEINQEIKDKYEQANSTFQKLLQNTETMADLLEQTMPELPIEGLNLKKIQFERNFFQKFQKRAMNVLELIFIFLDDRMMYVFEIMINYLRNIFLRISVEIQFGKIVKQNNSMKIFRI